MSFTDKENSVIKEKLREVQIPTVEEAWLRMSEKLGPPPVQKGFFQSLLENYSIYLNTLIGAILLTSGILLHSAVMRNDTGNFHRAHDANNPNIYLLDLDLRSAQSRISDLPILDLKNKNGQDGENRSLKPFPKTTSTNLKREGAEVAKLDQLAEKKPRKVEQLEPIESEPEMPGLDGVMDSKLELRDVFSKSHWGITGGAQLMPEVSLAHAARTVSGGLFYREFWTPTKAVQFEVLYNPIAIRPISYVEKETVNGVAITDSAQVQVMRYLSLSITMHYVMRERLTFMMGLQPSRLLGLRGELTRITTGSTGTDYNRSEFAKIKNVDAFAKFNLAFVGELNYQFSRWSLGVRYQQSMVDQSTAKLGPNLHRFSALQFRTAIILNK